MKLAIPVNVTVYDAICLESVSATVGCMEEYLSLEGGRAGGREGVMDLEDHVMIPPHGCVGVVV